MPTEREILIVGAGPTGLAMGLFLQNQGIPFRIIDKKSESSKHSKAIAVHARTLEVLSHVGVVDKMVSCGVPIQQILAESIPLSFEHIASRYNFVLSLPQSDLEEILESALETTVERGVCFSEIDHHFTYILGCDGHDSAVRQLQSISFEGDDSSQTVYLADKVLEDQTHRDQIWMDGKRIRIPLPNGQTRLISAERSAIDLPGETIWESSFSPRYRIAASFRKENVFLLGDAAHIHSPAGGQGLNTGVQDAYNLAWKLKLVIDGSASDAILDTYHQERFAIAKKLLRETRMLSKLLTASPKVRKKLGQMAQFFPSLQNKLAGLTTRYPTGVEKFLPIQRALDYLDATVPVGGQVLDLPLRCLDFPSAKSLYDLTHQSRYTLLFCLGKNYRPKDEANLTHVNNWVKERYSNLMTPILISDEEGTLPENHWSAAIAVDELEVFKKHLGMRRPSIALVRPDRVLAYRQRISDPEQFKTYCNTFFNHPTREP